MNTLPDQGELRLVNGMYKLVQPQEASFGIQESPTTFFKRLSLSSRKAKRMLKNGVEHWLDS